MMINDDDGSTLPTDPSDRADLKNEARQELLKRQARLTTLPRAMFGEVAWDLILNLLLKDGDSSSLTELASDVGVSASSAERWLNYLVAEGLVLTSGAACLLSERYFTISSDGRRKMFDALKARSM
ncbi:hypothetical protein HMF7854_11180 [Sphingomonas ginkgonis]|uniref:HTH iclR-type domain-containing protein n=1 Tax=Sphingomonas ginkgonis TaxID=2315330 RepID=A0A3R9WTC4_9SPHN|nr:helix-turn-helix domain-containing protein [Sphingomonas ginkgonis]RST31339.1 hypothetical protein HMF7854_11180 [Sphingomonas ginkgonis]